MASFGRFIQGLARGAQQNAPLLMQVLQRRADQDRQDKLRADKREQAIRDKTRVQNIPGADTDPVESLLGKIGRKTEDLQTREAAARAGIPAQRTATLPFIGAEGQEEDPVSHTFPLRLTDVLSRAGGEQSRQRRVAEDTARLRATASSPTLDWVKSMARQYPALQQPIQAFGGEVNIANNPQAVAALSQEVVRLEDEKEIRLQATAQRKLDDSVIRDVQRVRVAQNRSDANALKQWEKSNTNVEMQEAIKYGDTMLEPETGIIKQLREKIDEYNKVNFFERQLFGPGPVLGGLTGMAARSDIGSELSSVTGSNAAQIRNDIDQLVQVLVAPERHALFGGTFTRGEEGVSDSLFPSHNMGVDTIEQRLNILEPQMRAKLEAKKVVSMQIREALEEGSPLNLDLYSEIISPEAMEILQLEQGVPLSPEAEEIFDMLNGVP